MPCDSFHYIPVTAPELFTRTEIQTAFREAFRRVVERHGYVAIQTAGAAQRDTEEEMLKCLAALHSSQARNSREQHA